MPPGCPGVGGGISSFAISPRLTRMMTVLSFHSLSAATLQSIYCNLFQTWLEDFPAYSLTHHHQLAKVSQVYVKIQKVIYKNIYIFIYKHQRGRIYLIII